MTLFIEVKTRMGTKLERELVALLDRYGIANPASADQARVAVISFYPDALLRVRLAPLPTLPDRRCWGRPARSGGHRRRHRDRSVDSRCCAPTPNSSTSRPPKAWTPTAGPSTTRRDVQYARDLGVGWIATDHPGRTNTWLHGEPARPAARETST